MRCLAVSAISTGCYDVSMKINLRGGSSKDPDERKAVDLRIRLTEKERAEIDRAAGEDTTTWAREVLLKAARKRR